MPPATTPTRTYRGWVACIGSTVLAAQEWKVSLGADVAYIRHAAHALGVAGRLAHLTRRERDCAEAPQAREHAQRRTNKQTANKQTSKQANKHTSKQPNKRAPTNASMGSREAVAVANHSLLSVVARTAGMAWHGMAWHGTARHGMARHGTAWHRPSCDTRGEERAPRSTRRMSARACARMPGRLRVGTRRAFGLCLLLFGICWVC
jgi:hypothetical protein